MKPRSAVLSAGLLCIVFGAEAGAEAGAARGAARGASAGGNDDPAAACHGCHQAAMALDRFAADDLTNRLRRVRDGDTPHPPLNLDDDSDHALAELARRIVNAGSGA